MNKSYRNNNLSKKEQLVKQKYANNEQLEQEYSPDEDQQQQQQEQDDQEGKQYQQNNIRIFNSKNEYNQDDDDNQSVETDILYKQNQLVQLVFNPQNQKLVQKAYISKIQRQVKQMQNELEIKKYKARFNIKHWVSKNKLRFTQDGFDLDLSFITKRIIAMGYPASKVESFYRNKIVDVKRFLDQKFQGHYKIYNLCKEKDYKNQVFPNFTRKFAFEDHHVPQFSLIIQFCKDLDDWLNKDQKNVGVIHCKAGKGRTGTMICCYLMYCKMFTKAMDSLNYYGMARTKNNKGVTIPSQIRYVYYFQQILEMNISQLPIRPAVIYKIRMILTPAIGSPSGSKIFYKIQSGENEIDTSKDSQIVPPNYHYWDFEVKDNSSKGGFLVYQDVLVTFYTRRLLKKKKLFHFWFNTSFVDTNGIVTINKNMLDKAAKDKTHNNFSPQFKVQVFMTFPMNSTVCDKGQMDIGCQQDKQDEIMQLQKDAPLYFRKLSI